MTERMTHPLLGEITLSQSARARRITVTVRPSGEVRLSFPRSVSARLAAEFLDSKAAWVAAARQRMAARQQQRPRFTREEIERLRTEAKEVLPARTAELARQTGLRFGRVTVRATRSKWGSCSAQNNISLSLYLMTLPKHLADFVIIHELCHTVHHNHSPRFHDLVNRCTQGREKELQRELRRYSTGTAEDWQG